MAAEGDLPTGEPDPFEGMVFDEDFVRAAPVREPTAADRERAARQQHISRLLEERQARRDLQRDELRRGDAAPLDDDWAWWDEPEPPRRRRRPVQAVALVVLLAMVVVYVLADHLMAHRFDSLPTPISDGLAESSDEATSTDLIDVGPTSIGSSDGSVEDAAGALRPEDWPALPEHVSEEPLGAPGAVPGDGGPHTFVATQSDGTTPVGYDPCREVHYVSRTDVPGAPASAARIVAEAIAMVSAATGLVFVDDGNTDEAPADERAIHQPERYGDRWAPVLVAWSDEAESPDLGRTIPEHPEADVAGYAASRPVGYTTTQPDGTTRESGLVFVSGQVVLDAPDLTELLAEPDGYALVRAIVAHEIGHLVGLGHVEDPNQLMYPATQRSVTGFAPGDLEGLARLGSLACFPTI